MMFFKFIRGLFSLVFLWYLCLFFVFYFSINAQTVRFKRLNATQGLAQDFISMKTAGKEFSFRDAYLALLYFRHTIWAFPKDDRGYAATAYCLFYLGKERKALEYYKKADELDPGRVWYKYNIGVLYLRHGRVDEAKAYFEAVDVLPLNEIYSSLGICSLSKMEPLQRQLLFKSLVAFSVVLKQKVRFLLANLSVEKAKDTEVLMHPWVPLVLPGKERFFN